MLTSALSAHQQFCSAVAFYSSSIVPTQHRLVQPGPIVVKNMIRRGLSVAIICLATALPGQQSRSSDWQSALVLEVKEHHGSVPDKGADPSITRYDVSIRVNDTEYL